MEQQAQPRARHLAQSTGKPAQSAVIAQGLMADEC